MEEITRTFLEKRIWNKGRSTKNRYTKKEQKRDSSGGIEKLIREKAKDNKRKK